MNILYIEDDKKLAKTICDKLKPRYNIDLAYSGKKGIKLQENKEYDLIILDYFLPDTNGIEVCKKIRELENKAPILVITVNSEEKTVVDALNSGADDFLTKPFSFKEFEARIRALIRRGQKIPTKLEMNIGELYVRFDDRLISYQDKCYQLPRQEYLLLKYLVSNTGNIVSKEEIYEHVWGKESFYNSNTIEVHIRRLRNRLKELTGNSWIKSIYGRGYKIYN